MAWRTNVDSSTEPLRRGPSFLDNYTCSGKMVPFSIKCTTLHGSLLIQSLTPLLFALTIPTMKAKLAGFFRPDHDPPQDIFIFGDCDLSITIAIKIGPKTGVRACALTPVFGESLNLH